MWPYPWTPSHLGHMDRVAATMPSQAHAGAAQEAPDIGQWEGQDIPFVRPSPCNVKGGIPSSRRYLPTYLPPPLLAGVLGCVCVFVCALLLYPATPGSGVRRWCVCLGSGFGCATPPPAGVLGCVCARSPFTQPLLVGVCDVGVCAWALGCAPPLLAGVFGCVCACVRAPLVPRHSWLGRAVWVCLLGLGIRLRPATLGWCVGVCVCLFAHSAGTSPVLAGLRGVGGCARPLASAAPRHSWLGCWDVRMFVLALRWYPASPCLAAQCGGLRLAPGFGCAPLLLAGVLGCACARSACTPPLLAGLCGVGVCAWAQV